MCRAQVMQFNSMQCIELTIIVNFVSLIDSKEFVWRVSHICHATYVYVGKSIILP